jgi:hypothetical protein
MSKTDVFEYDPRVMAKAIELKKELQTLVRGVFVSQQ